MTAWNVISSNTPFCGQCQRVEGTTMRYVDSDAPSCAQYARCLLIDSTYWWTQIHA